MKFNLIVNARLGWTPALDGLRGVAVLAVMLFHLPSRGWVPGGSLGVDLFFVLSGFLITTLLLQEHVATGTIDLRAFYVRRIRRLLPALLALLLVFALVVAVAPREVTGVAGPASILLTCTLALAYLVNVVHMIGGGVAPGMSHLWSLGVEEQFYLVWPALLVLAFKLRLTPFALTGLTAALATGSAALPLLVEGSHGRFYNGPDFRAQELLAGAVVGQLYVGGVLNRSLACGRIFKVAVGVAAGLMSYWLVFLPDLPSFLFGGYYAAVAVCCAWIVSYVAFAETGFLTNKVMCYVGRRSYALYLWHMPINVWLRGMDVVPQLIAEFVLSFLAAELSYRLVESRFSKKRRAPEAPEQSRSAASLPARAA